MLKVCKRFEFQSAHFLPHYEGDCHNLHGHSYKLDVEVIGTPLTDGTHKGMLIDFKDLKKIVEEKVIKDLDHSLLNDTFENPTAELMAEEIFSRIKRELPDNVSLYRVRLWETEKSYAEFFEFPNISIDLGNRLMQRL